VGYHGIDNVIARKICIFGPSLDSSVRGVQYCFANRGVPRLAAISTSDVIPLGSPFAITVTQQQAIIPFGNPQVTSDVIPFGSPFAITYYSKQKHVEQS